jgi:serine/threonine-protein kinase
MSSLSARIGRAMPGESSHDEPSDPSDDPLLREVADVDQPSLAEVQAFAGGSAVVLTEGSIAGKRYRLERELGRGGMGVVWEATHLITQRRVAIKFVLRSVQRRSDLRRRFFREARAASTARHPNVVEVLDVFDLEDGTPAMVMELLSGETLRARLVREGKLPLDVTVSLFLPVIAAVSASHAMGIVHRDLKPENVFLVEGAVAGHEVKVLDFGVAKLITGEAEPGEADPLTGTGSTLGTPCYMAPEQTTCEKDIDARADVWALGVMLYECLAGVRPLVGSSVGQVVMKLMTDGIRPLAAVAPHLPPEASALVMRMLSRSREDRPQSLAEVTGVLAGLTQPRGVPVRARRRSAAALVAAGAVLLLALATWTAASLAKAVPGQRSAVPVTTGAPPVPALPTAPADAVVAAAAPVASPTAIAAAAAETKVAVPPVRRQARPDAARPAAIDPAPEPPVAAAGARPVAIGPPLAPPPAETPSPTAAPSPAAPDRDCDPPYEFDRQGRKLWKRQCL